MAEDIDKVKADFEKKISGFSESGKAAAKASWNRTLDRVRVVLLSKIAAINALKVSDALINTKLSSMSGIAAAADKKLKGDVLAPATKALSSYSSERLSSLKKTMSTTSTTSSSYSATIGSISKRNEFNKTKIDDKENGLKQDVETLNQLKF